MCGATFSAERLALISRTPASILFSLVLYAIMITSQVRLHFAAGEGGIPPFPILMVNYDEQK